MFDSFKRKAAAIRKFNNLTPDRLYVDYQRAYIAGDVEGVTCSRCFDEYNVLFAMLLRYKDDYFFECSMCGSKTTPGKEFRDRLEDELRSTQQD